MLGQRAHHDPVLGVEFPVADVQAVFLVDGQGQRRTNLARESIAVAVYEHHLDGASSEQPADARQQLFGESLQRLCADAAGDELVDEGQ